MGGPTTLLQPLSSFLLAWSRCPFGTAAPSSCLKKTRSSRDARCAPQVVVSSSDRADAVLAEFLDCHKIPTKFRRQFALFQVTDAYERALHPECSVSPLSGRLAVKKTTLGVDEEKSLLCVGIVSCPGAPCHHMLRIAHMRTASDGCRYRFLICSWLLVCLW